MGVYDTTEDDTDTMTLYVNGVKLDEKTTGLNLDPIGHENMVIGESYEGGGPGPEYDEATIDEMRLYRTALSSSAVQELCERDAPVDHPCAP